jgi:hypothetical protein
MGLEDAVTTATTHAETLLTYLLLRSPREYGTKDMR